MHKPKQEILKLTAPTRRGYIQWSVLLSFGLVSYLKQKQYETLMSKQEMQQYRW